jgi:hypothetical protein
MTHKINVPRNIYGFLRPAPLPSVRSCHKPITKVAKILLTLIFATCLTSCTEHYDFPLQQTGNYYTSTFNWVYEGHPFELTMNIPKALYWYYRGLPKDQPYINFTEEYTGYRYQDQVAKSLVKLAEPYHFNRRQMAEYLLTFVQTIGYTYDPVSLQDRLQHKAENLLQNFGCTYHFRVHDYPRYLVEVLMEKRQDCEDASIAAISLWRAMGFYSALIDIPKETHMAAGISLGNTTGTYYIGESGRTYEFAECTNLGWKIGKSSKPNDSVFVYEVQPLDKLSNPSYQFAHNGKPQPDVGIMNQRMKPQLKPADDTGEYAIIWDMIKNVITQK